MVKRLLLTVIKAFLPVSLIVVASCSTDKLRQRINFNNDWKFTLSGDENSWRPEFDDSGWRTLTLPHDWSIEGRFDEHNTATTNGGALPGGTGWYRKTFTLDQKESDKVIYIDFDGVYRNSEVWINGHYLGKRPYGYSSFRYELTPYLHWGSAPNKIAVKVDNSIQPNSRWYSGSGIYRNVWLVITGKLAINHWGTFITSPRVSRGSALLNITTQIKCCTGKQETVKVKELVYNEENKLVGSVSSPDVVISDTLISLTREVTIKDPVLWSDKKPYLYHVVTEIEKGNIKVDTYETIIGIRSFSFDSDKGFLLNGERVKIRGVCDHHDLGCLGAAINTRALERQPKSRQRNNQTGD